MQSSLEVEVITVCHVFHVMLSTILVKFISRRILSFREFFAALKASEAQGDNLEGL